MKYILVAISGAADQPTDELGGKTPFEVAKIPNLQFFTKTGRIGQVKLSSDHVEPNSDVTFLNALGYDADKVYTGLGPLEAANLELKLEEDEIPFRMNFITESGGILADATAGGITNKEARALINYLNKKMANDFVRLFPGTQYRHIAVLKDSHGFEALSAKTISPHSVVGQAMESFMPKGPGGELIKKLMFDARLLLQDHEINQVRVDLQENPANMIWLWGQGKKPVLEKFSDRTGLSGAILTSTGYAKGVARLSGLTLVELNGVSEDLPQQYEKKGKLFLDAIEEKDFVCIHVRGCDDAARSGDLRAKISALEATDFYILSKIKSYMEKNKDTRVLVTACHATPWKSKKRVRDAVPFSIAGKNIMADDHEKYSEVTAKISDLQLMKSTALMPFFLAK